MLSIYRDKRLIVYRFGEAITSTELETFKNEIYTIEKRLPNFYTKLLVDFSRTKKIELNTLGITEFGLISSQILNKRNDTIYISCFAPTPLAFGYARMAEMAINNPKAKSKVVSDYGIALKHINIKAEELQLI